MNGSKRVLLSSLAAALFLTAFPGCRKTTAGEYVRHGVAAADRRDWKAALKFAEKGVACAPQNVDALLLKALAAQHCKQPDVACAAAEAAVRIAPENFFAQYMLGCVCLDDPSRKAEAKAAFQRALRLRGGDRYTLIALCNLTAETNDPDMLKYIGLLEKCIRTNEKDDAIFRNQKGVALLLAKRHDNALREFNAAQRKDWNDPNIVYNAACAYDFYRLSSGRVKKQAVRELYERYLDLTAGDKSAEPIRKLVQARVKELGGR